MIPAQEILRILALTDEVDLIADLEARINHFSPAEIISTTSYLDLIEHYTCRHTRLLILDTDLLNEKMIQLVRIVRAINSHGRILLWLSQEKIPLCSEALSFGMISYLIKPISVTDAANIVCSSLEIISRKSSMSKTHGHSVGI